MSKIENDGLYTEIGKALISVQRTEYVAHKLVEYMAVFEKEEYDVTSKELNLPISSIEKLMLYPLSNTLSLLKLTPRVSIKKDFEEYIRLRNQLTDNFWRDFIKSGNIKQKIEATSLCACMCKYSYSIELFLKGMIYLLAVKKAGSHSRLNAQFKKLKTDFDRLRFAIQRKSLFQ